MPDFRVNGFTIHSDADFERLIKELDAQTIRGWGRPLSANAVAFIRRRYLTTRNESQSPSLSPEVRERLEIIWKRREEEMKALNAE